MLLNSITHSILIGLLFACNVSRINAQQSGDVSVFVVGVDGLNVIDLKKTPTPNIDALRARGSWTYKMARCVSPPSSSPNWASMIMGAPPEKHGIWKNGFDRDSLAVDSNCVFGKNQFPTIFSELKKQQPKARIGFIHQWFAFKRIVDRKNFNKKWSTFWGPGRTMAKASKYHVKRNPRLTFIHLNQTDHWGHKYGHGSEKYIQAVNRVDDLVGKLMKRLKRNGELDKTIVILTSDHGGKGHGHSGDSFEVMTIPWIIAGPGIRINHELQDSVVTYDTAVTIGHILGLDLNNCWTGKVIQEAMIK